MVWQAQDQHRCKSSLKVSECSCHIFIPPNVVRHGSMKDWVYHSVVVNTMPAIRRRHCRPQFYFSPFSYDIIWPNVSGGEWSLFYRLPQKGRSQGDHWHFEATRSGSTRSLRSLFTAEAYVGNSQKPCTALNHTYCWPSKVKANIYQLSGCNEIEIKLNTRWVLRRPT